MLKCWLRLITTGENLDAVTAVTDSFKMADTFTGDRTGGAVAQTSAQTIGISVWQGVSESTSGNTWVRLTGCCES